MSVNLAAVRRPHQSERDVPPLVVAPTNDIAPADSVERAYIEHYAAVFRFALALTRSIDDAEDLTADVFARALRAWTTPPPRPIAWLLLTARHLAVDRARRARRLVGILDRVRDSRTPEGRALDAEFRTWFDAVTQVLTRRQWEALVLRYERDLSDAEIGEILGLSASGVRSLVARALATLREHPELL